MAPSSPCQIDRSRKKQNNMHINNFGNVVLTTMMTDSKDTKENSLSKPDKQRSRVKKKLSKSKSRHELQKHESKVNLADSRNSQENLNADIGFLISQEGKPSQHRSSNQQLIAVRSHKRIRNLNSVESTRSPRNIDLKRRLSKKTLQKSVDGGKESIISIRKTGGSSIAVITQSLPIDDKLHPLIEQVRESQQTLELAPELKANKTPQTGITDASAQNKKSKLSVTQIPPKVEQELEISDDQNSEPSQK